MRWEAWLGLGLLWLGTLRWAYRFGQKQSVLFAAQLLEHSRYNVGKDLAKRIRQEYDKRLRKEPWSVFKDRWPTE